MQTTTVDTKYLSFEEQSLVCELRSLQQKSTALIDSPKKYVIPDNRYFYPLQSRPSCLDIFQELIERDLRELQKDIKLTIGKRKALKELSKNPHIVVCSADKGGGGITVLDNELYQILNLNMLNDEHTYKHHYTKPENQYKS